MKFGFRFMQSQVSIGKKKDGRELMYLHELADSGYQPWIRV